MSSTWRTPCATLSWPRSEGADFVAFPESYPGPWRMPTTYDPTPAMVEVAQRCGVHVQFGTLEPIDEAEGTAYNLAVLAYPSGAEPGRYRRTYPPGPWSYPRRQVLGLPVRRRRRVSGV